MENLILKAKNGSKKAMKEIIETYKSYVLKVASKYEIPEYEFEDVVHHGYLSIIKAVRIYESGVYSRNEYFNMIIENSIISLSNGNINHYREIQNVHTSNNSIPKYNFTVEDELIAYNEIKKLYKLIDSTPRKDPKLIERYYLQNNNLRKIASEMDIKYITA